MLKIKKIIASFKEDLYVFRLVFGKGLLKYFYYPTFRVIFLIRLSQVCYLYKFTRPIAYLLTNLNDFLHGVWIGPKVKIGKGFSLPHPRGVIIHPDTIIGDYCSMLHQVTIGGDSVYIGNNVEILASAQIINDKNKETRLVIGDEAVIAAGAVVLMSVPSNTVVAGVPSKTINIRVKGDNWLKYRLQEEL